MEYTIGLIGSGKIVGAHIKGISQLPNLQVIGVADLNKLQAESVIHEHGLSARAYESYKEMVVQEKPDIVLISLPHFLHKESAIWCASQGCHILLEKPMALNVAECNEIIEAVNQNRVRLMIGQTQRFMPALRTVKDIVDSGEIGELVMINDFRHAGAGFFSDHRSKWCFSKATAGGGIMTTLASHSIDKIQFLTDSRITNVKAATSYHGHIGDVEGSGLVFAETERGVPATISSNGYKGVLRIEIELIGTKAMLRFAQREGLFMTKDAKYEPIEIKYKGNAFTLQMQSLLKAIATQTDSECSPEYGKSVIAVLDAIYESADTGKETTVKS
jgi:predicted dehydrogenase